MEQSTMIVPVLAGLVAVVGLLWIQTRSSRRVRRSLERADARARALHRH